MREVMRLIVEEASEAEVSERLGRGYCERGAGDGYRNVYRRGRVMGAEGTVEFAVPQAGDTTELWRSEGRGCNVLEKTDDSEYGKFGWVIDPEGKKVELWQPPQGQ